MTPCGYARLYDPEIGRFIQADSLVEPEATQGLNRYSYAVQGWTSVAGGRMPAATVLNNPLTHTDPTGQLSFRQVLGIAIGVAAAILSAGAATPLLSFSYAVGGGFVASYVATGNLKSALWGAVSAAVFWGIGQGFSETIAVPKPGADNMVEVVFQREVTGSTLARVAAHAGAGGVLAELQGGSFGSGFLSAGVTKALSPAVSSIGMGDGNRSFGDLTAQTVVAATIGGTASAITGNGFGSGAQTAAFQYLFNQSAAHLLAQRLFSVRGGGPNQLGTKGVQRVIAEYQAMGYPIVGTEVVASIASINYTRRYDFATISETNAYIGIEVNSTERGLFRMDRDQFVFDIAVLSSPSGAIVQGAQYRITGVAYEGVDFTTNWNARWQQGAMYRALEQLNVKPKITR